MTTSAFPPARHLLALDWGTSSLRAALMAADGTLLDTRASADGILSVPAGGFDALYERRFGDWLAAHPDTVTLAAGMVGSRQGWHEAPYLACPAGFSDMAGALVWPDAGRRLAFVPGLQARHAGDVPDVMRGEEVQIFGALDALGVDDAVFVLPGTHSKWAVVQDRRVMRFHTFMTGELYALLRRQSILARLMPDADTTDPADDADAAARQDAFLDGCRAARDGVLLHSLFSVRARGLFAQLAPTAQPEFLSGLLVGEEIREALGLLAEDRGDTVCLVCNAALAARYRAALAVFEVGSTVAASDASFGGLLAIARARGLLA